ncbi:phosphatidylinositol mannoside acyltransferase [Cryptosporangium sp. NPDC048952]|uniref:phosphatidylinositol mannoside acyltransferase n=1 Tax=Cryptosporangium sp. NPDC048952 TaxID=3363961 RepID=UPI0037181067
MNTRVTVAAYAAGWKLVRVLPERPVKALFEFGAARFARRGGPAPTRLAANLRRVVGPDADLDALTEQGLRSYARYWHEAFRLPDWSEEEINRRFVLENVEVLDKAVAAGNGAIVALPHAANWDLAGAWATLHGIPVTTVAERLKPEDLYQRFLDFRRRLGMEILPLTGGTRHPLDVLTERAREGRVVVLLADRDLSSRGIEVEFFGETTKMPAGPAILALRTGAPLFGLKAWNDGPMTRARVIGPLEVLDDPDAARDPVQIAAVTQRIADALAEGIAEHPVDWHMLQPLWLADLPARKKRTS